jgi:hypothetical protein
MDSRVQKVLHNEILRFCEDRTCEFNWPKSATINESTTLAELLYISDHHTGVLPPLAAESTAIRSEVEFLQEQKSLLQ